MIQRDHDWGMYFTIDCNDSEETKLLKLAKWSASISRKSAVALPNSISYQLASVLCWSFNSPYRKLRDIATKGTINLLRDKPSIVIRLIQVFDDVNDPYIQQRLYAVVHGCVFRGSCNQSKDLAKEIYSKVFDVDMVRSDILLRDYARCSIDYISQSVNVDDVDFERIKPPYHVNFDFSMCPDRQTVENKYRLEKGTGYMQDAINTQNRILDKMETEYSNGVGGYGDFGRYTFEAALNSWSEVEGYDVSLLRNYALQIIFDKYGFDPCVYARHDNNMSYSRGNRPIMERFGKKYQWIAMYELLGLMQDNYLMKSGVSNDKEVQCEGSWDPHVRDIDTTNGYYNYYDEDSPLSKDKSLDWTHCKTLPFEVKSTKKWLTSKEGMSKALVRSSIEVKDEFGVLWIVLYGYNTMTPSNYLLAVDDDEIGLWEFLQAYIVSKKNRNNLCKLIYKKGTQGRGMPEHRNNIYELYYKDYFKSASYREYSNQSGLDNWNEFDGRGPYYQIGYKPYICEGEMSANRPNKLLYEILGLKDGDNEGEYVNDKGELIAFDPSVTHQNESQLLVRKDVLLPVLKKHDLSLVWPVLFEKQLGTHMIGYQFGGSACLTERGYIRVKLKMYVDKPFNPKKQAKKELRSCYVKLIWYTLTFNNVKKTKYQMKIKICKYLFKSD